MVASLVVSWLWIGNRQKCNNGGAGNESCIHIDCTAVGSIENDRDGDGDSNAYSTKVVVKEL